MSVHPPNTGRTEKKEDAIKSFAIGTTIGTFTAMGLLTDIIPDGNPLIDTLAGMFTGIATSAFLFQGGYNGTKRRPVIFGLAAGLCCGLLILKDEYNVHAAVAEHNLPVDPRKADPLTNHHKMLISFP